MPETCLLFYQWNAVRFYSYLETRFYQSAPVGCCGAGLTEIRSTRVIDSAVQTMGRAHT
jgi:hypothetical protein